MIVACFSYSDQGKMDLTASLSRNSPSSVAPKRQPGSFDEERARDVHHLWCWGDWGLQRITTPSFYHLRLLCGDNITPACSVSLKSVSHKIRHRCHLSCNCGQVNEHNFVRKTPEKVCFCHFGLPKSDQQGRLYLCLFALNFLKTVRFWLNVD